MTYAFVQYLPAFTAEHYAAVVAELGDEPIDGLLAHLAGPCDGGWRIIQVWRSPEAHATGTRKHLWPALGRSGVLRDGLPPPSFETIDVHHLIVERLPDGHRPSR